MSEHRQAITAAMEASESGEEIPIGARTFKAGSFPAQEASRHPMRRTTCPAIPLAAMAAMALGAIFGPMPANAAFVGTNGTDPEQVRLHRVAVAVVEVTAEQVDQERKRQGYVLHRHLDLKILRHLYGPKPGAAGLAHVPYTPWVNSAWPHVRGSLVGRRFLMAWRHGQPCGLGSTVSFGSRIQLPLLVSGPQDPWVAAVATFLALPRAATQVQDRALLETAFQQTAHPRLSILADAALLRVEPGHRQAPRRILRLLSLVDPSPKADELLGVILLADLQKIPGPKSPEEYARLWGGQANVPRKLGFDAYRLRLARLLAALGVDTSAEKELRRVALMSLSQAPIHLAPLRDQVNAKALEAVLLATRDGVVEVRRSALVALLAIARSLHTVIPSEARRTLLAVRAGVLREQDPNERVILVRQLGGLPKP